MKNFLLITIASLFLIGCASTYGNKDIANKDLTAQIKAGITTKAEVKEMVGEPSTVTFTDNNEEMWEYAYTRSDVRAASFIPVVGLVAGGADIKTNTLTVRFRDDGIVKSVGHGSSTGGGGGLQDLKN